ncbi:hypothetical protein G6M23_21830 [Agrobacterium tumefaciens]|nr:hypothetical protein [Agrobacterium tumefaciens]NTD86717.1 hypothetical protein [Agrobacterium tumefaciens]NTD93962.1 hypothetical protein [Agrobacterium tumefaciens]NTE03937.1 hypothetical protein [Agrobacterium tumefaciens]NTE11402.1 hypothetical protein [Agrobacterium tumefaciens]
MTKKRGSYPNFINGSNGKLYFTYRSGDSGNGEWVVNVRDDQKMEKSAGWRNLFIRLR